MFDVLCRLCFLASQIKRINLDKLYLRSHCFHCIFGDPLAGFNFFSAFVESTSGGFRGNFHPFFGLLPKMSMNVLCLMNLHLYGIARVLTFFQFSNVFNAFWSRLQHKQPKLQVLLGVNIFWKYFILLLSANNDESFDICSRICMSNSLPARSF